MMITLRSLAWTLAMIVIAGVPEAAAQQAQTVTGRVVDGGTLSPLPGVSVHVEGSNVTALTGADGRYSIQAPGTATLLFSTLGYSEHQEAVDSRTVINVTLQAAALMLDELVTVGYSQQNRATVSGAVSQVSSEDLESQTAYSTTASALAGMVAGISVRTAANPGGGVNSPPGSNGIPGEATDGRPGAVASLSIRNMGDPLYVIDGIPSDAGSFNHLNSSDIETISILKDASAAVYGFRASNGVVLVTTKRGGREQAPQITINGDYGFQDLTRFHYMNMYDAADYVYNLADANTNSGVIVPVSERDERLAELAKWQAGTEPGYQSTNYFPLSMNNPHAPAYSLDANVSGGTESAQYYLSAGHQKQEYNVENFTWGRSNLVANLSVDLSSNFRIGTELRAQQRVTDGVAIPPQQGDGDAIRTVLWSVNSQWPTRYPYLGPNDEYLAASEQVSFTVPGTNRTISGPMRRNDRHIGANNVETQGWTKDLRRDFVGNFWAQYTLPFGTTLRGTFSLDTDTREWDLVRRSFSLYCHDPVTDAYLACATINPNREREHLRSRGNGKFGNLTLTHSEQIGGHNVNGTLFAEMSGGETNSTSLFASSPTNYTFLIENSRLTGSDNTWNINRRASVGGRVDYDYNQKYLVTLLARYDGSYLYAPDRRWGLFPGVSLGWRISEEPFLRDRFGFLEDLKIRASWGETGSERGQAWGYLQGSEYGVGAGSVFDGSTVTTGVRPLGEPNLNLTWLTNVSKNVGLDVLLFDGRVSIETDLFERVQSGIPATRSDIQIPQEAAFPLPDENLNEEVTRGWEMAVRWNDQVGRVQYSLAPNFTIARSRPTVSYGERYGSQWDQFTSTGGFGQPPNTSRWNGASQALHAIGQFTSVEQIQSWPVVQDNAGNRNLLPGDLIFEDVNGDGIINDLDERTIGFATGGTPIVSFGAATSVSFEGLTLNVNWAGGAYFSHQRQFEMQYANWSGHNGPAYGMDRWRRVDPFNPQSEWIPGRYPPMRNGTNFRNSQPSFSSSDFWRTNVKFLKVRTMELSYSVPDRLPATVGLSGVRLFTNLSNPFSLDNTRHYMMDPEVGNSNGMVYPSIRMLQFGFRATVGGVEGPAVPVPTLPAD